MLLWFPALVDYEGTTLSSDLFPTSLVSTLSVQIFHVCLRQLKGMFLKTFFSVIDRKDRTDVFVKFSLSYTRGLCYKTVWIHNAQKMEKLCSKLVSSLFSITFISPNKHSSLLHDPFVMN